MKYFIRSVKYFVYLTLLLCLIILILVKMKLVESNISSMFINGYDSLWQMALIIAAFSALYPRFGYCKRLAALSGSNEEIRPILDQVMENRGYKLESETQEEIKFIKRSPAERLMRRWEDRLTITREMEGYQVEGPTKDVVRIVTALENFNGR